MSYINQKIAASSHVCGGMLWFIGELTAVCCGFWFCGDSEIHTTIITAYPLLYIKLTVTICKFSIIILKLFLLLKLLLFFRLFHHLHLVVGRLLKLCILF
jgi:hypothetical protein